MQKFIALLFFLAFNLGVLNAQIEFGFKAGLSSYELLDEGLIIQQSETNQLTLNLENLDYGVHFGLYSRVSFLNFYIEPGLIFNSASKTYRLESFDEEGVISSLKSESFRNLDIPLKVGYSISVLRFHTGPVAHVFLDAVSNLSDIDGFKADYDDAKYAWLFGAGIDIWKLRFDVDYELGVSKFGEHITINGSQYHFNERPSRILFSLGYKF